MRRPLLIRSGRLIDGTLALPREDVNVLVVEGRVAAISWPGGGQLPADPADCEVIDARDLTILPGLIDSHMHLAFSASPDPVRELLAEDEFQLLLRAAANAQAALAQGVTTVFDCGGFGRVIPRLKYGLDSGTLIGPRVLTSGMPITTQGGHCYWLGLEADDVESVRNAVRRMVRWGVDFIKVMVTGGHMTSGSNPRALQYGPEHVRKVAEESHRLGRKVVAHAHSSEGMLIAARAGVDVIAHASCFSSEGVGLDEEVVEVIARHGVALDPTLTVGLRAAQLGLDRSANGSSRLSLRVDTVAALRRFYARGVTFLAGTDGGIRFVGHDEVVASIEQLVSQVGLSHIEAIRAATHNPARALGREDALGTVEVGKPADLILVSGDPLRELAVLRSPRWVIARGRIVAEGGRLLTVDHSTEWAEVAMQAVPAQRE